MSFTRIEKRHGDVSTDRDNYYYYYDTVLKRRRRRFDNLSRPLKAIRSISNARHINRRGPFASIVLVVPKKKINK